MQRAELLEQGTILSAGIKELAVHSITDRRRRRVSPTGIRDRHG